MVPGFERKLGLTRKIGLVGPVEEAEGLANVEAIATSSPRLEALILVPCRRAEPEPLPDATATGINSTQRKPVTAGARPRSKMLLPTGPSRTTARPRGYEAHPVHALGAAARAALAVGAPERSESLSLRDQ